LLAAFGVIIAKKKGPFGFLKKEREEEKKKEKKREGGKDQDVR